MNYVHLGACVGDWGKNYKYRCGFTELIKKKYKFGDNVFLVEANPKNIPKLKKSYKGYKNIYYFNIGISSKKDGNIKFYYTDDDKPTFQVCSINKAHVKKHYPKSKIKNFSVKTMEINNFLEKKVKNKKIDFLSIDLEGIDYDIATAINYKKFDIQNISIEYLHLNRPEKRRLINKMIENGYSYCGFGYDHNNFDYLFRKKKIIKNKIISKFVWLIPNKYLHKLNNFVSKN